LIRTFQITYCLFEELLNKIQFGNKTENEVNKQKQRTSMKT